MSKTISTEEFNERLRQKLRGMTGEQLLAYSGIYEIVSEELNNEIIQDWENEQEDRDVDETGDVSIFSNSFEAEEEILLHRVAIRFWGFESKLTPELEQELLDEGKERAREMIQQGYVSGELNHLHAHDTQLAGECFCPGDEYCDEVKRGQYCRIREEEIRGAWEIVKD